MGDAEKLLRNWMKNPPKDGAKCEDALRVAAYLDMEVESNNQGHHQVFHTALLHNPRFSYGSFTINCHAKGVSGRAHQKAILDIIKAAKIIQATQQKEQQDNEDDN